MVGKEWNSKILANLPVTIAPKCTGSNAKTLGLKHLQFPDMGTSSTSPVRAHVVHHWTDELLIQQDSVPDGDHCSLGDDTPLPVSEPLSHSIDIGRPGQKHVKDHPLVTGSIDASEWLYEELHWFGFQDVPIGLSEEHLSTLCNIDSDPPFSPSPI